MKMNLLVTQQGKPVHDIAEGAYPPGGDFGEPYEDRRIKLLFLGSYEPPGDERDPTLYFLMTPRNVTFDGSAGADHATYFAMTRTSVTATVWDEAVPTYVTGPATTIRIAQNQKEWWLPFAAPQGFCWKLFDQALESEIINLWVGTVIKRLFKDHKQRAEQMYNRMRREFREHFDTTVLLRPEKRDTQIVWPDRRRLYMGHAVRLAAPAVVAALYLAMDTLMGDAGLPWVTDVGCYTLLAVDWLLAARRAVAERSLFCR